YQGCDFCGGWIKDWKLCEDPYIQHAKYFPECDYVKLCMPNDLTNRTQHLNEQGMDKGCRQENVEQVFHRTSEKRERTKRSRRPSESLDFADKITAKKTRIRATGVSAELPASTAFTTTSAVMSETNFSFTAIAHSPVTPASAAVHQAASPVAPSTSRTTNCSPMTIFSEIIQEQDRVLEENRKLKDRVTCKICLDKDACIVFIPCGHMVSCIQCAHEQKTCAVCRGEIKDTIRVYPA
ncbi:putative inhibitor of apoptosis, partial [Mercenaria mercenaria]|uniref:putative inhibitor of apoptosis n=1 Tax=Mercenaria mercenaria TaxID=6596 RepID=UPI00234EFF31